MAAGGIERRRKRPLPFVTSLPLPSGRKNRVLIHLGAFYCLLRIEGPSALVRQFPRWFKWSPMAENVRSAMSAARDADPRPPRV